MAGDTTPSDNTTSTTTIYNCLDNMHEKKKFTEDSCSVTETLANSHNNACRRYRKSITDSSHDLREDLAKKTEFLTLQSLNSIIDPDGLSRPSYGTRSRMNEGPEQTEKRVEKMCDAVRTLLECVGEDPDREGLLDTPSRYVNALLFLTKGYEANIKNVVNNALFHEGHNEMVVVKNIDIHSLCEHHLVPFFGKIHIGYIPVGTVIGLSKLPRIVEVFSRRLQVQERLTREVADAIEETLRPQGVAVVMESSHLCMAMRGVEKTGTIATTSCMLGCFKTSSRSRRDFFSNVGIGKK